MPELPEVENLRIGLEKNILDQKILRVEVRKPKLVSGKGTLRSPSSKKVAEFIKGITGEKFTEVERRGKNLIFHLTHGKIILVHLKMSGQFVYQTRNKQTPVSGGHPIELSEHTLPNKHSHVIFELQKGTLYFNDTRMFGYLLYYPSQDAFEKENHFGLLGFEPFDPAFTLEYFRNALKNKNGKIKPILMDQKIVTGLGNIYADESLFEARIRPDRTASSLTKSEVQLLHRAILRIMKKAVETGGSSVATYILLDKTRGNYAREHKVYGKSGGLCPVCGGKLKTTTVGGRTTVFCPRCQT
jgi:formamidopyrimidine-DNA glycosylase